MRRYFRPLAVAVVLCIGVYSAASAQMQITGGVPSIISGAKTFSGLVTFSDDVTIAAAKALIWSGRSKASSPADGVVQLTNNAADGFTRLVLGTNDASGVSIAKNGTTIRALTGNGGALTQFDMAKLRINNVLTISDTAPTIASGGCTSPAVTSSNGTAAFLITIGTTCAGVKTITLTFPAASNFWSCAGENHTSDAAQQTNVIVARATSVTAVVLTSYDRVTGLQEDFTDSNTYLMQCLAN